MFHTKEEYVSRFYTLLTPPSLPSLKLLEVGNIIPRTQPKDSAPSDVFFLVVIRVTGSVCHLTY